MSKRRREGRGKKWGIDNSPSRRGKRDQREKKSVLLRPGGKRRSYSNSLQERKRGKEISKGEKKKNTSTGKCSNIYYVI